MKLKEETHLAFMVGNGEILFTFDEDSGELNNAVILDYIKP